VVLQRHCTSANAGRGGPAQASVARQKTPEAVTCGLGFLSRRAQGVSGQKRVVFVRTGKPGSPQYSRSCHGEKPWHRGMGPGSANCATHLEEPSSNDVATLACARGSVEARIGRIGPNRRVYRGPSGEQERNSKVRSL
jgi:hypothetical protein